MESDRAPRCWFSQVPHFRLGGPKSRGSMAEPVSDARSRKDRRIFLLKVFGDMSPTNPLLKDGPMPQPSPHEPSMEEILASIRRIIADDRALLASESGLRGEAPRPDPNGEAFEPGVARGRRAQFRFNRHLRFGRRRLQRTSRQPVCPAPRRRHWPYPRNAASHAQDLARRQSAGHRGAPCHCRNRAGRARRINKARSHLLCGTGLARRVSDRPRACFLPACLPSLPFDAAPAPAGPPRARA